jgi:glucan 1,6-alpha-glucosidase
MNTATQPWWKSAVIYQIYPRSFMDANGDGIGDLPGVISKLDYLTDLGINAIWLSPVFRSPQDDNGYDVSDYRDIDPLFGTLADMDRLIAEAKKRGIRIILDMVLNHSSDEHRWFLEAKKSRDNPYHDYYIWRDGEPDTPPNEMLSSFGGSAWEWVPALGQYYFHQYSVKQPDLNWENPALRQELYQILRWWAARGVGGFRLDVVDHFGKEPDKKIRVAGPRLHEYIRELSSEVLRGTELVTVGEAWSATPESAKLYSNPDGSELSMVFQFEHIKLDRMPGRENRALVPLPFLQFKQVLSRWQTELYGRGWNSLFWENHDLPRCVSRWGDDEKYRVECAKMLAVLLFGMQGTPYIYQGQELGMTNADYALEDYRDIGVFNHIQEMREDGFSEEEILYSLHTTSRDNARTPMQWSTAENAGFTAGKPWIRVNPNYLDINAAAQQADPDSVWHCYQKLIALRRQHSVFQRGYFELLLEKDEAIFAYTRTDADTQLLVLCNFYGEAIDNPLYPENAAGELLFVSYPNISEPQRLRPYEARIYRKPYKTE